jgi:Fe-S oxidoreductase
VTVLQWVALALAVVATVVGVASFALGVAAIVRVVRRGGPAPDRTAHPWRRVWLALTEIVGHRRFRSRPAVIVAHWLVMVSFPILFLTLVASYGQIADPGWALPVVGHWLPLEWLTEAIAWASLLGIVGLMVVRQVEKPRRAGGTGGAADEDTGGGPADLRTRASRFFGSNAGQAYFVEVVVLAVVVCVLLLRGLEYALAVPEWEAAVLPSPRADVARHFPLTAWFGGAWASADRATLEAAVVVVALVKILVSATWLTVVGLRPAMGVSWHRFTALVNVWARRELDGRPALGPVPPVRAAGAVVDFDHLEDLPEDARLGVGRVEDLTWKGLLDLATCTECGRCQEACPAWATGKALSPKLMVLALRDHAFATTPGLRPGPNASTAPSGRTAATGHVALAGAGDHAGVDALALVGDVVDPQALWDCTTCGACVQACPVDIEHVDLFVDLRRHEVLMESAFPAELGKAFAGIERRGNPWGAAPRDRLAWTKGLDFPVPVIGRDVPDASELDYLFWVGCAGAYDDRARRTSRAVAELLHTAGVRFAVLGEAEGCSGDPARRAGNELLFQQQARATIETLTEAKATRIVVTCPHCLNALGNEYPQLGGVFEVVHHTELLDRLVAEGRLRPTAPVARGGDAAGDGDAAAGAASSGTVTYHDPCYLGRHNGVYTPPRELVAATGLTLTEMPRTGERAFCCGGGGARAFMEESTGTRIATERGAEALATGAGTVATGCPFCVTMLTQGVGAAARDGAGAEAPEVVDVAVLLLDAVRGS